MNDTINTIHKTSHGSIVQNEYMVYLLTPCCNASATGTSYGTACRGCYNEIDSFYGMCANTRNTAEMEQFIADAKAFLA